mmetsp:Transcript_27773/g.44142  ORF Transcript_27773/g.44142 Transcript_27773/m.44142 type:complete len:524 (+) Transcript_27773:151-1722(+)
MIQYNNESVLTVIFNLQGSVLPQCVPVGLLTFSIGLALALIRELDEDKQSYFSKEPRWIEDPYPVQVISIVLCFVLIMRTNMALDRWMGGISDVQLMLSKWGDAFDALNAFFSGKTGSHEELQEILMFRIRVAHWFSLMSCVAFATLRNKGCGIILEEVPIKELFAVIDDPQDQTAKSFVVSRKRDRRSKSSNQSRISTVSNISKASTKDRPGDRPGKAMARPRKSAESSSISIGKFRSSDGALMDHLDLMVLSVPSTEEVALLEVANDKPNLICLWIIQGVIIMIRKKLLDIPPPIVSRVFQELSNGMLGFNQAYKVALVPFPFPFAQLMSVLLCAVYILMPFYIDLFTQNPYVTPIISFFLPTVYCALNNISVELEEPFGVDQNDVDIEIKHEDFLWLLVDVLRAPKGCPSDATYELEKDIIYGVLKDCPLVAPEMEPYLEEEEEKISQHRSSVDYEHQEEQDDDEEDDDRVSRKASVASRLRGSVIRRCMKDYGEDEQIWPASFGMHHAESMRHYGSMRY